MIAVPRVSMLVPTIGRLAYLDRLIASVEAQAFRDAEILVLDNASPPEVVRSHFEPWAARDSRVRLVRCEPRVPMFANFNRGIRAARGEYVVFFHDDDVYLPELVTSAVALLGAHPRAAFAGTNYDFIDEDDQLTEQRRWIPRTQVVPGREYIEDLVSRARNLVPMPGLVFRRDALGDGFDEQLPIHFGDFTLLMRLAEGAEVALIAEPLVRIRRHAAQASVSMPLSKSIPLRTEVLEAYLREYEARHPRDGAFVQGLRRRVQVGHLTGLLWGWLTAPDASEARACAAVLGELGGAPVVAALDGLERLGLRTKLGADGVRRALRRVAPTLKL